MHVRKSCNLLIGQVVCVQIRIWHIFWIFQLIFFVIFFLILALLCDPLYWVAWHDEAKTRISPSCRQSLCARQHKHVPADSTENQLSFKPVDYPKLLSAGKLSVLWPHNTSARNKQNFSYFETSKNGSWRRQRQRRKWRWSPHRRRKKWR